MLWMQKKKNIIHCMCSNYSWKACIHQWTVGSCQDASILCRKEWAAKRSPACGDACMVEPCGGEACLRWITSPVTPENSTPVSAPPPHTHTPHAHTQTAYARVWCMMRRDMNYVEAPYVFPNGPDALATGEMLGAHHKHKTDSPDFRNSQNPSS